MAICLMAGDPKLRAGLASPIATKSCLYLSSLPTTKDHCPPPWCCGGGVKCCGGWRGFPKTVVCAPSQSALLVCL